MPCSCRTRPGRRDLLLTGEGAFDWQSLRGKVVAGVARVGQASGRPTVVLAGRVEVGKRELANAGIDSAYGIVDMPPSERGHSAADGAGGPRGAGCSHVVALSGPAGV